MQQEKSVSSAEDRDTGGGRHVRENRKHRKPEVRHNSVPGGAGVHILVSRRRTSAKL